MQLHIYSLHASQIDRYAVVVMVEVLLWFTFWCCRRIWNGMCLLNKSNKKEAPNEISITQSSEKNVCFQQEELGAAVS